jgi:plastocyanin
MQPSPPLLAAVLTTALAFPAVASPREPPPASATAAGTRIVEVADDRYSPKRLTVAKGTRVEWVWSRASEGRHDVYLDQRPEGAARFRSPPATAPFSFARKLRKPGTYKVLCTLHEKMRMRIDVGR